MSDSKVMDVLNKYVRKLDWYVGRSLDAAMTKYVEAPAPPAPAETSDDKYTDTPPADKSDNSIGFYVTETL